MPKICNAFMTNLPFLSVAGLGTATARSMYENWRPEYPGVCGLQLPVCARDAGRSFLPFRPRATHTFVYLAKGVPEPWAEHMHEWAGTSTTFGKGCICAA